MATKIIAATVQVDTGNSNANIKEVNTNLKETKAVAKDAGSSVSELAGHFDNLKKGLTEIPGSFKEASESVNTLGSSFKALLANPVVLVLTAIVAALAFLYKSFTNTAEGGEKMEQVLAGVKAAAKAVLDAIFDLGGAIIKFFSGDFTGAFEQAKQAVTGVVDAVKNAYTATVGFTKQLQELHKEQLVADVAASKRATDLAKLREEALDPDVPVAKRKELIKQLAEVEEKAAADDIARAKKVTDAKIGLLSIGKDAVLKNRDEIAQAEIDFNNKQTEAANEKRRIDRLAKQADKQEAADAKAAAAAAKAEAKKKKDQDEAAEAQLRKIHEDTVLAGITDQYAKETQLLENKIADEKAVLNKEFEDGKLTRAQYNALTIAEDENAAVRRLALIDKHNKDLEDAEQKHQDEIEKLRQKARDQAEKDRIADEKKKLEDAKKRTSTVLNDPKSQYKARQAAIDAEQAQLKEAFNNKIITESEYNDEIEVLAQDRIKIKQEEQRQNSVLTNAIGDAFNTLADIAGKQTAAGKALAIAGTTIKTIQAGFDAFAGMVSTIPGPVGIALGIVAAAGAVAAGVKAVEGILAVNVPGQGSGGSTPNIAAPSIAAPVAPSQSSTSLNQSSINQIGQNIQPVQAYVVESDNAAAVNRAARLQGQAVLGGH